MIRLLRVARRSAMKARTQAGNQIHAVVDTAPEQLRRRFVGRPTTAIVAETALFRRRQRPDTPLEAARLALRTLARRWEYLNDELVELDAQLDELTAQAAPTLRAINGVGAQVATALLAAAGDNPDRLRSSSSFAALCGVSPIDASSGRQRHHRLNRYGDRQANWALHVDHHQPTPLAPTDPGLHGPPTRRGTHQEDGHALPQTTPHPRSPPRHHHRPRPRTDRSNDAPHGPLDIQGSFGKVTALGHGTDATASLSVVASNERPAPLGGGYRFDVAATCGGWASALRRSSRGPVARGVHRRARDFEPLVP